MRESNHGGGCRGKMHMLLLGPPHTNREEDEEGTKE